MSDTYLESMTSGCNRLRSAGDCLLNLADALYVVGNSDLAVKLESQARKVMEAEVDIRGAVGQKVHDDFERSEQASRTILGTALAVATGMVGADEDDDT